MENSQRMFDGCFKCGYCGYLINSYCENLLEHQCLKNIYIEGEHDLVEDQNKVLTIVQKQQGHAVVGNPDLSEASDEILIKLIQDRPPLYDCSLPLSQRTAAKKTALWVEIYNRLGGKISLEDIQKKWKYLRDRYNRAKKRMNEYRPSGSEASAFPTPGFNHFELMRFVDDCSSDKQTVSSVTVIRRTDLAERNRISPPLPINTGLLAPTCTDASTSSAFTPRTSKRTSSEDSIRQDRCKKKKEDPNVLENEIATILKDTKPPDGVDGFLIRLGESLRRIPYRERFKLELNIMNLVYETECNLDTQ